MIKQLNLFPELAQELVSVLDDKAIEYVSSHPISSDACDVEAWKRDMKEAFKDGMLTVLGDVIDIVKNYTTVYEA